MNKKTEIKLNFQKIYKNQFKIQKIKYKLLKMKIIKKK